MRGPVVTRSRLSAARAVCAGTAIIAAVLASGPQARAHDETAIAVPRPYPLPGGANVALPQPLTPADAALAHRAFAQLASGKLAAAEHSIAGMQSALLLGHLQAVRDLGRFHTATVGELRTWLGHYADQPDAPAMLALLRRRLPRGAALPPVPPVAAAEAVPAAPPVPDDPAADAPEVPRPLALEHAVLARARKGDVAAALRLIDTSRRLPAASAALLRGKVARVLFTQNDDAAALRVAQEAAGSVPPEQDPGLGDYVGGLAAWRMGDLTEAMRLFAAAADAPLAPPQRQAAAAFWSARGASRLHAPLDYAPSDAERWLRRAAEQRTALHGMLARTLLNLPTGIAPSTDALSQADVDAVAALDGGWRAFALLQAGQPMRAAAELRGLWPEVKDSPALRRALLLVAAGIGLTDCAGRIAALIDAVEPPADGAVPAYPIPRLHPAGGFRVDPALVYAVARVESNFDPDAVSAAGARGLMQLMPVTAQRVGSNPSLNGDRLQDPALNLELGQRYLLFLSAHDTAGKDLLRLLASYNAGPGGVERWQPDLRDNGDPLLFIEAIPVDETRQFVKRALTWTWIYAARLRLPAPSLDQMASGAFPRFTPLANPGRIVEALLH